MDVTRREKFRATGCEPPFPGSGLTFRAVAIPAAVVGDGGPMPAVGALVKMPAQCGGATPPNGQQHFNVLPTEPAAVSFEESSSRGADEIGHLEGRPAHLLLLR